MSQVPEESYTQATFRNTFKKQFEFPNVTVMATDADGTHFYYDDARGERHFGVITDLIGPSIVRRGQGSVTIPANGTTGQALVNFSPVLVDPDGDGSFDDDYLCFANPRSVILQGAAQATIVDEDTIHLRVSRPSSSHTHNVDILNTTSTSADGGAHTHDVDPASVASSAMVLSLGASTFTVDWIIIRA